MKQEEQEFKIEVPESLEDGMYSNLAVVMHSQSEFVLDFVHIKPNNNVAKVKSRVLLTPDNMKRLMRSLQSNVQAFEQEYGVIRLPEDQSDYIDLSAQVPQGEA